MVNERKYAKALSGKTGIVKHRETQELKHTSIYSLT